MKASFSSTASAIALMLLISSSARASGSDDANQNSCAAIANERATEPSQASSAVKTSALAAKANEDQFNLTLKDGVHKNVTSSASKSFDRPDALTQVLSKTLSIPTEIVKSEIRSVSLIGYGASLTVYDSPFAKTPGEHAMWGGLTLLAIPVLPAASVIDGTERALSSY